MRKIVATICTSLDGVVGEPWTWPQQPGDETDPAVWSIISNGDAMLFGRVTYEEFSTFWPEQTGERADQINEVPKYVVSTKMKSAHWKNTTIINRNVGEELAELKRQSGRSIVIAASGTLVRRLLFQGLVDELHLFLYPLVIDSGKRLFVEGVDQTEFEAPGLRCSS